MQTITTIGLDIAKSVFQVHGVDAGDSELGKQLRRQPTGRVSRMARSCAVRRLEYRPATRRKLLRRRGPTQRSRYWPDDVPLLAEALLGFWGSGDA